ncbi:MAG: PocR ligand-binding domain-containing protein [Magnetococcales bacterium]|nr:PocR ligand-binding domain-containing protein [Magnetococcales bacterium]
MSMAENRDTPSDVPFGLLLDFKQLQRLLDNFCDAVGIASAIIDLKGKVYTASRWQRICTGFHRQNPVSLGRCLESDTELALRLNEGKRFAIYRCRNGLTDAASPIIVDGLHVANVFVGQFLQAPPDLTFFSRQAEDLGFAEDYLAALADVPVIPEDKLPAILGFLTGFAEMVAHLTLERRRAVQAEEAMARERTLAVQATREARLARDEAESFRWQLEIMVQERTAELTHANALLEQLFNNNHTSVVFLDSKFNFIRVNHSYARDCAREPDFFPGKNHFALFPHAENEAIFRKVVESGEPFSITAKPFEFPEHPEWGISYWDWSLDPIRGKDGRVEWLIFILREVTQNRRTQLDLIRAKEQAESASNAKSQFLTTVSHEIRTPMNVVLGMGELLSESGLTGEQLDYVERLRGAGRSLLGLIDQILDLSRIESGEIELSPEPVPIHHLLHEITDQMRGLATGKALTVTCEVDPGVPPWIRVDQARLRQILFNLLGNAIRFTSQGFVRLLAGVESGTLPSLALTIEDSGIGIADHHLTKIFDSFTQADSSVTRRFGGSGLGLTISRHLVERMGGHIRVQSQLHVGSTFFVTLPFGPASPPPPRPDGDQPHDTSTVSGSAVLLVEDSPDNQLLIQAYLKNSPHTLAVAADGEKAVEMATTHPWDLIFMDVQMPAMDGYTATRLIRRWEQENRRPPVTIIALTAHALEGERERSQEAGCDFFLTKPIKKRRLLEVIRQVAEGTLKEGTL